ncbi:MAG: hypothetical protein KBI32_15545 [Phycisphaerae bacterium]|nr:hypothetical protein [Phycisphaerae bacterium]
MNVRSPLIRCSIITFVLGSTGSAWGSDPSSMLVFRTSDEGQYTFDTGILRGVLRQKGTSRALSSVVHIPSGMKLDGSVGIAGHYRVFTINKRYGTAAWDWPSNAALLPDGSVRTTWPAAQDRPFEMTALYRWADPQTLDVETTVTAHEDLTGFESFFASYFDKAFPSPYVLASPEGTTTHRSFMLGEKSQGDWLMFTFRQDPRNNLARDGRWLLEPHPVNWTILPRLDAPLCLRRGEGHKLTVVMMAPRQDGFAVAMPHEGESHYSLYLSLFGRDFKAGESAQARTRLVIAENLSDSETNRLYRQYLTQLGRPK